MSSVEGGRVAELLYWIALDCKGKPKNQNNIKWPGSVGSNAEKHKHPPDCQLEINTEKTSDHVR